MEVLKFPSLIINPKSCMRRLSFLKHVTLSHVKLCVASDTNAICETFLWQLSGEASMSELRRLDWYDWDVAGDPSRGLTRSLHFSVRDTHKKNPPVVYPILITEEGERRERGGRAWWRAAERGWLNWAYRCKFPADKEINEAWRAPLEEIWLWNSSLKCLIIPIHVKYWISSYFIRPFNAQSPLQPSPRALKAGFWGDLWKVKSTSWAGIRPAVASLTQHSGVFTSVCRGCLDCLSSHVFLLKIHLVKKSRPPSLCRLEGVDASGNYIRWEKVWRMMLWLSPPPSYRMRISHDFSPFALWMTSLSPPPPPQCHSVTSTRSSTSAPWRGGKRGKNCHDSRL